MDELCVAPDVDLLRVTEVGAPDADGPDADGPDADGPDTEGLDADGSGTEGPGTEGSDAEGLDDEGLDDEGLAQEVLALQSSQREPRVESAAFRTFRALDRCRHLRRSVRPRGVAVALLLTACGVTTASYLSVRGDLVERDRVLATRSAERDRLTAELATLSKRRDELDTRLRAIEGGAIEPAGYEKIRQCVQTYAGLERWVREHLADSSPSGGTFWYGAAGQPTTSEPGLMEPTACSQAEPYLR